MRLDTLNILAPGLLHAPEQASFTESFNETETLGAVVWLWMHSHAHRDAPLHTLSALLLPALKQRQFVLVMEQDKPVFYLSWAQLDAAAEARYLRNPAVCMAEADWHSGERMWILDWVAPFGHTRAMMSLVRRRLLANRCIRTLYHRGDDKGFQIKTFHGIAVLPEEARYWFEKHPVTR